MDNKIFHIINKWILIPWIRVHQKKKQEKRQRNFKINTLPLIKLIMIHINKTKIIILPLITPLKHNNKLLKNKTLLLILRNNKRIREIV